MMEVSTGNDDTDFVFKSPKAIEFDTNSPEDSGYSSDSSVASSNIHNEKSVSQSSLDNSFLSPDTMWKGRLRFTSTPHCSNNSVATPDFATISGPLLRSHINNDTFIESKQFVSPKKKSILWKSPVKSVKLRSPSNSPNCISKLRFSSSPRKKCVSPKKNLASPSKLEKSPNKANSHVRRLLNDDTQLGLDVEKSLENTIFTTSTYHQTVIGLRRISMRHSNILLRILDHAEYLLPKILSFLPDKNLIDVSRVNSQLRRIILGTKSLSTRRNHYMTDVDKKRNDLGKENLKQKWIGLPSRVTRSSPRKPLQQQQNLYTSKPTCSIPSSLVVDIFFEAGKKLRPGEIQEKCTKCSSPSHLSEDKTKSTCTRRSCQFISCVKCQLEFHGTCTKNSFFLPRPKSTTSPKKLDWKKRLRRL